MSRAGIIPYFINHEGDAEMLFMISSNPRFGGGDPAIAKGRIDRGETALDAAIREGKEELGLLKCNMLMDTVEEVWSGKINGLDERYKMTVFKVQVMEQDLFATPHFETAETVWMTLEQFEMNGRSSHTAIVRAACEPTIRVTYRYSLGSYS